ncbi:MAG: hypothetical protein LBD17_03660 [Endomicrobium sp.]|jgi:hypothetical protein|nr:hypothetical protein [Endomicrobium sp.]
MGNCNCKLHSHDCFSHCEAELEDACMRLKFCKSCGTKDHVRVCAVCGARYALEYERCPSCSMSE